MADLADVVVVGGGIAGASLACALAREDLGVTLLEASEEYQDRVRGESMQLWGVREARQLGVERVMLDAGAHIAPLWKQYMEGLGEAGDIPMGMFIDGVDGTLNLRHPVACQALAEAAAAAGSKVVRGAKEIRLSGDSSPTVSYVADGVRARSLRALLSGRTGALRPSVSRPGSPWNARNPSITSPACL